MLALLGTVLDVKPVISYQALCLPIAAIFADDHQSTTDKPQSGNRFLEVSSCRALCLCPAQFVLVLLYFRRRAEPSVALR